MPAAADQDTFQRESAIIGVIWLIGSLAWLLEEALKEDTDWGIATRRARILHYLESAIRLSADAGVLSGTHQVVCVWLDVLRSRWPSCEPLALYPAFAMPAAPSGPTSV